MKTHDKVLLFVLLVLTAAAALAVILLETKLLPIASLSEVFCGQSNYSNCLPFIIAAAVILLIDLRLFIAEFMFGSGESAKSEASKTQIENNELGASYITVAALNAMARKRCMMFRFVSDCTTNVTVLTEGIIIAVKVVPLPDSVLPEALREMQAALKAALEEQAGIRVSKVTVLVLPPANKKPRTDGF